MDGSIDFSRSIFVKRSSQEVTVSIGITETERCRTVVDRNASETFSGETEFRFKISDRTFEEVEVTAIRALEGDVNEGPAVDGVDIDVCPGGRINQASTGPFHHEAEREGLVGQPRCHRAFFASNIDMLEGSFIEVQGVIPTDERCLNEIAEAAHPGGSEGCYEKSRAQLSGISRSVLEIKGSDDDLLSAILKNPHDPGIVISGRIASFQGSGFSDSKLVDDGIDRHHSGQSDLRPITAY